MVNRVLARMGRNAFCVITSVIISFGSIAATVQWQVHADLPYRTQEIYPIVFGDFIIVAGGLSPDVSDESIAIADRVVIYDINNDQWFDGMPLPEPRHHGMLVNHNGEVFLFGGFIGNDKGKWENSTNVLKLDLPQGQPIERSLLEDANWIYASEMPQPLAETLAVSRGGNIHLATGRAPISLDNNAKWNDHSDVSAHLQFIPSINQWVSLPSASVARNSGCAVVVGDNWHTIGGRIVNGGNKVAHEVYSFVSNTWSTAEPMPEGQAGLACASLNNKIYVFGGEFFENGGGVYHKVWEYDPAAEQWNNLGNMPEPRHGLGAVEYKNRIYLIGGAKAAGGNLTSSRLSSFSLAH